jgi:hypothetical protein
VRAIAVGCEPPWRHAHRSKDKRLDLYRRVIKPLSTGGAHPSRASITLLFTFGVTVRYSQRQPASALVLRGRVQEFSGPVSRAYRFPVSVDLRFRPRGASSIWVEGRSINVSRSGLLLESERPPAVGTPLEVVLDFGAPLVAVRCFGLVVRASAIERDRGAVALTITRYRLIRQ